MIALTLVLTPAQSETILVNPEHIIAVRQCVGDAVVGSTVELAHRGGTLYVEEEQSDIFDRIMAVRR